MARESIKYELFSTKDLDQSLVQGLRDVVNKAGNSTAFHDIDFNLFISNYFLLQSFIIVAFKESQIQGFLIFFTKEKDNLITSPYQLSLSTYGGPVSLNDDNEIIIGLLKSLKKHCGRGSVYIKSGYKTPLEVYRKTGYKIKTIPTLLIPIDRPETEIWRNIDNRIKRNIKKAWKSNIEIFRDNGEHIDQFAEIYKNVCERKRLHYHGAEYYRDVCKIMQNDVVMSIFYATMDTKIISAMSILEFKDIINPWFGGTKTEFIETGVGSLLYWEIIKYGSLKGYKLFDFLGLDIGPIAFYKKGFGGNEADVCHAGYTPMVIRIIRKLGRIVKEINVFRIL